MVGNTLEVESYVYELRNRLAQVSEEQYVDGGVFLVYAAQQAFRCDRGILWAESLWVVNSKSSTQWWAPTNRTGDSQFLWNSRLSTLRLKATDIFHLLHSPIFLTWKPQACPSEHRLSAGRSWGPERWICSFRVLHRLCSYPAMLSSPMVAAIAMLNISEKKSEDYTNRHTKLSKKTASASRTGIYLLREPNKSELSSAEKSLSHSSCRVAPQSSSKRPETTGIWKTWTKIWRFEDALHWKYWLLINHPGFGVRRTVQANE